MTRMLERWFPSSEVSQNSDKGWGSGATEKSLFTWFAARPSAQAKAALLCSLLPWPDNEEEQAQLQALVREAMSGRFAMRGQLREEILRHHPDGLAVLDPFSGRGMIPLEAARLGIPAYAIDYSPVAVLATHLLADFPFRDWTEEPPIPIRTATEVRAFDSRRLLVDVEEFLNRVGARFRESMAPHYPTVGEGRPWGYLWAVTLPCQECGQRFPLVGSYELRRAGRRRGSRKGSTISDEGQAFYIEPTAAGDGFHAVVHPGAPRRAPTLSNALGADGKAVRGKSAVCPFCAHVHPLSVHQRLASEGRGEDAMLVVAEPDPIYGRVFREPTAVERRAAEDASQALAIEGRFSPLLAAVPDEAIPLNNGATIRPQLYGAKNYGDLMVPRQTLAFVRLCRTIEEVSRHLMDGGTSLEYARALSGYAAAVMVRMLKFSTRGARMRSTPGAGLVDHIFTNESTIAFSYDFFEVGLADGPGSWPMMAAGTVATLKSLWPDEPGTPVSVTLGTAASQPFRDASMTVVVTDPPYDSMVYYADSSDFFYVWLKRALAATWPELSASAGATGVQDKTDEIIVKEHGKAPGEHRDRRHYDTRIADAFAEMRRVIDSDGLVTIVFGHGEPEVWQRLLGALGAAGLVMTGSWPARTEAGGQQGKANIETTLTMACRPAPPNRPSGRRAVVESEVRAAVHARYAEWERWGLAPTDMLMAAAGPAMEVVGRYAAVLDARGETVDPSSFLPIARAAVQDAMALEVGEYRLETFDARTRFALWWIRLYGKQVVAKSELRWQALASSVELADVRDLVPDIEKGCRFTTTRDFAGALTPASSVIDIALVMARASDDGLQAVGDSLSASGRDSEDPYLWAAIKFLADRFEDADADAIAWTRLLRNRPGIAAAANNAATARTTAREPEHDQLALFDAVSKRP